MRIISLTFIVHFYVKHTVHINFETEMEYAETSLKSIIIAKFIDIL